MSGVELVLGVVLELVVNEMTDLSPWLGRLLVRWSARLRYGGPSPAPPAARSSRRQLAAAVAPEGPRPALSDRRIDALIGNLQDLVAVLKDRVSPPAPPPPPE